MSDETEWMECVGGPLDGQYAEMYGLGAFAWPCGWYYTRHHRIAPDSWVAVYEWNGDGGCYIPSDHEQWLAGQRPRVVDHPPVNWTKAWDEIEIDEGLE